MEIPLEAQVECTDMVCGRSAYLLINPVIEQVTHLVVRDAISPYPEYIVPIDFVSATTTDAIQLRCSRAELEKMDPFVKTRFIEEKVSDYTGTGYRAYGMGSYFYWPYVRHETDEFEAVEEQQLPVGEMAVHRGTRVEATDGFVGRVDEFMVDPKNGHITHLVMREGHLWGKKDVNIPISALGDTREDTMFLKLNKHQIELLPTFPVHRRWS
jgi:hypothetical protein